MYNNTLNWPINSAVYQSCWYCLLVRTSADQFYLFPPSAYYYFIDIYIFIRLSNQVSHSSVWQLTMYNSKQSVTIPVGIEWYYSWICNHYARLTDDVMELFRRSLISRHMAPVVNVSSHSNLDNPIVKWNLVPIYIYIKLWINRQNKTGG